MSIAIQPVHRSTGSSDVMRIRDGRLLERFIERRDQAAFESLVRLHGPMVFGVCRRVLGNHHDAEEAFQATFLVLAQKARFVKRAETLANWLYRVAHRTSCNVKRLRRKLRQRETSAAILPEASTAMTDRWPELAALLDDELSRLSEQYRVPILLCDLQGHSRKSAAEQLGCPEGTLVSRLLKGRTLLAARLTRRGVALSAGGLVVLLSQNLASASVPGSSIATVVRAATIPQVRDAATNGLVSSRVATLAGSVSRSLLLTSAKTAAIVLCLVIGLGSGARGLIARTRMAGRAAASVRHERLIGQLEPMVSLQANDVREQQDMGVWAHPEDSSLSTVISSSKRSDAICVYDLEGNLLQRISVPNPKGIDIRQRVRMKGKSVDLVVMNCRSDHSGLRVYRVDPGSRLLERWDDGTLQTGPSSGGCLYHSRQSGRLFFVCTSERGNVEQYELHGNGGRSIRARLARTWNVPHSEAAVADDELGLLYVAEEEHGVWKFPAEPDGEAVGELVAQIGEQGFRGDAEGLAIARMHDGNGYLIVADRGESQFRLYDRQAPHGYVGKFSVAGAQRSRGIEACAFDLNSGSLDGVFVCQSDKRPWPLLVTRLSPIIDRARSTEQ